MKNEKRNRKTLIGLIVTIIILMILVGIAITELGKKRPQVKQNEHKLEMIEKESSIEFSYDIEEINGDKLKILIHVQDKEYGLSRIEFPDEDVIIVVGNKTQEKAIDYEIECDKEYIIKINSESGEEKEVKILEIKVSKPNIIANTEWTNQNVTVEVDYGINSDKLKKEISIDGGKTYSTYIGSVQIEKNTIIKARATGEKLKEEAELKITNIDKLAPNDFTPTVSDTVSSTEFTINANATDAGATEEYGSSGIKEYQYYVYKGSELIDKSEITTSASWNASGLTAGETYKIYVIAYDVAGNSTKSNEISGWICDDLVYECSGERTIVCNIGHRVRMNYWGDGYWRCSVCGKKFGPTQSIPECSRECPHGRYESHKVYMRCPHGSYEAHQYCEHGHTSAHIVVNE